MKKILFVFTVLFSLGTNMAFADSTYADRIMDKQFRAAMRKGCEYIEVKDPGTAASLGLIFGAGSFYTGATGMGIASLITWPFSILWDPAMAKDRAEKMNKKETILNCQERGYKL